ncbi:hypothetical protein P0136_06645 [Lentisphaerota bacterium ZTH]|nr:hypothetical protein JYG24_02245 [Lentisphaerota bacterium]WET07668.1 hypothetical protein P0136_06645 [Lentisphaerota bacterium ZTH]
MLFDKYAEKFPVISNAVIQARKNKKLSHAYLLHGDTPQIRKEFSAIIAQIAVCPEVEQTGKPCGTCKACRQLEDGTYPELYSLMPVGKAWQIPVGDRKNPEPNTVRWFEQQFYLTSITAAGRKIGVIFDCDRMKAEAQNAFLKTLEEPPRDSLFILATGNPSALLPTTRSRCQALSLLNNCCSFDFDGASSLFKSLYTLQFEAAGNLALAEECVAKVVAITNNLKTAATERVEAEWEQRLTTSKELEPAVRKRIEKQFDAAVAGEYIRERTYFMSALHTWFAQTYHLSSGASFENLANPEIFDGLKLPGRIDEKEAARALNCVDKMLSDLRFNVNEELAIRTCGLTIALN